MATFGLFVQSFSTLPSKISSGSILTIKDKNRYWISQTFIPRLHCENVIPSCQVTILIQTNLFLSLQEEENEKWYFKVRMSNCPPANPRRNYGDCYLCEWFISWSPPTPPSLHWKKWQKIDFWQALRHFCKLKYVYKSTERKVFSVEWKPRFWNIFHTFLSQNILTYPYSCTT